MAAIALLDDRRWWSILPDVGTEERLAMQAICCEFADGSYFTADGSLADAMLIAADHPSARVWYGDDQIQQGFVASDDVSGMY